MKPYSCIRGSILALVAGILFFNSPLQAETESLPHYVEYVVESVEKQCALLEELHGVKFGPADKDMGNARVANNKQGIWLGVRAPMAEHEKPIMRVYYAVEDIQQAVQAVEAAGGMIAYPPTQQGQTGTWSVYIMDGIQHGLWQRPE